jgi:hypothetical protein
LVGGLALGAIHLSGKLFFFQVSLELLGRAIARVNILGQIDLDQFEKPPVIGRKQTGGIS